MFGDHFPEYNFIWMASFFYITLLVLFLKFGAKWPPGGFGIAVEKIHNDAHVPPTFYLPMFFCALVKLFPSCVLSDHNSDLLINLLKPKILSMILPSFERSTGLHHLVFVSRLFRFSHSLLSSKTYC